MAKYRHANKLAEEKEAWIVGNIGNLLHARGLHSESIEYLQRAMQISQDSEYIHRRLSEAITARDEQTKKIEDLFTKVARRNTYPLPEHLRLAQPTDSEK
jgi:uncharacterized coiled-coil DUF342 family protein